MRRRMRAIAMVALVLVMLQLPIQAWALEVEAPATAAPVSESAAGTYTSSTVQLEGNEVDGVMIENMELVSEDLTVQGVSNRNDIFFEIGESRQVQEGSFIELHYTHSPTLLPKRSTLTILVDDMPMGSVFLDESNLDREVWRLDLSELTLEPGFHKISVITHMEVTSNICDDQNNSANWMRLYKESTIHLKLTHVYDEADLAYFPSPLFERGSSEPMQSAFVLPDDPTEVELEVLTQLAQFFNTQSVGRTLQLHVYTEKDLTLDIVREEQLIWIGASDRWSGYGQEIADRVQSVNQNSILITSSPWNEELTSMILHGSGDELIQAGRMLTDPGLRGQLYGSEVVISPADVTIPPVSSEDDMSRQEGAQHISFGDMGYSSLTVESLLVGGARVVYNIPPGWEIEDGAKLHLSFRHSKTLNFAQSVVSVKVNQVPVGSERLNEVSSDLGSLDIPLDPNVLRQSSSVTIDIAFQFSSNMGTEACTGGNAQIGNWAVIDEASFLSFSYEPRRTFSLALLPSPLDQTWAQTCVILPKQPSSEELSLLADVVGRFAQSTGTVTPPKVVFADEGDLETRVQEQNFIYIGEASHIPAWLNSDKDTPLVYREGYILAQSDEIELLDHVSHESAWLQLMSSPLNEARNGLLLSATDRNLLPLISNVLSDPQERAKVQGNVAVIDKRMGVHSFSTVKEAKPELTLTERVESWLSLDNKDVLQKVMLISLFMLIFVIIGIVLWLWRKKRP